jgi:NAD(P)-dependent dehydrogenase (short-subunit alcohol dehydrogenase family)
MRSVVITGTSTGIGWGCTKILIENGFRVFGSVRKAGDAERLTLEFGDNFVPLVFDVTDEAAVNAAADQVRAELAGETLFGLVNNAGIAVFGPLIGLPIGDFRRQIEVNLVGMVIATKAFAPLVGTYPQLKGRPGRIINIGSVGGRMALPFGAPYNASKFAVEGLSESLRRELLPFGIDVIVIGPGAVKTEIWAKGEQIDTTPYVNTLYEVPLEKLRELARGEAKKGLPPERIGEAVLRALTAPKPKVRYAVSPQPVLDFMLRTLPKRLVDRLIAGQLGLSPKR